MNRHVALAVLVAVGLSGIAKAEVWVDGAAAPGGTGTADAPFQSIGQAIKTAKCGDVITIRSGIYHEAVTLAISGTAQRPTVLRSAPGHRVVLSGFAPVKEWQPGANGVYTAVVDGPVSDLYVGLRPQAVARWPEADQPLRYVKGVDAQATSFQDAAALPDLAFLKNIADSPRSGMAFMYVARGNYYTTIPLKRLDLASGTIGLAAGRAFSGLTGKNDRYQLANHPGLIQRPGQWAFEVVGEKQVRIHFRPADAADLVRTQYRKASPRIIRVGTWQGTTSHIRIEGLEICGSARDGLEIERSEHVTVERCIFHNNTALGARSRRSNHVTFRNNIAVANGNGISVVSGQNALVEGNEVALNMVDGVTVGGNISGKPDGEPTSANITIRRNYIHHHQLLGHPDNIQAYRGVKGFTIEDNVLLHGGQAIMTEEVDGGVVRNCIIVGTSAVAVIFGHANSNDWTVENSTVGLGGWGAFSLTGKTYRFRNNIVWGNPLGMTETLTSDHNVFFHPKADQPIYLKPRPKWTTLRTPEEIKQATGLEAHSQRIDPGFRNAPAFQAVAPWHDLNRADRLGLRVRSGALEMADFEIGDRIEINGDGIVRRITAVGADAIEFTPPLPVQPFRDALVWNWKKAQSLALDLRPKDGSPALTAGEGGRPAGASLDITAFQRGDFDGDGERDIPELPEELRSALPNPNDIVIPLYGS